MTFGSHPETLAVRAGIDTDSTHGAVVPPLYLTSTFTFEDFALPRRYDYTRSGNPTRDVLAHAIADLEGGVAGIVTATGMAAITCVLQLLGPDDLLIAPHDCYGGSWRLFTALARKHCFRVKFIDINDTAVRAAAFDERPKMVWLETPSNPLLRITDIRRIALEAHAAGSLVVVDNTFLSPVLQKPIALGADVVVHSTTKYLNGHSDVVGGAIVCRDDGVHADVAWWANCLGVTGSPFDSFLTLRGLRTLGPRMQAHELNARVLAELLQQHPAVARVHYPGLASHAGHEIAKQQQRGFGAMLSFELAGGEGTVRAFLKSLRHFSLAESLGGVESLVAHPATMTHAAMSPEARYEAGITDSLLRLSVGIEHVDDLAADISAALESAATAAIRRQQA